MILLPNVDITPLGLRDNISFLPPEHLVTHHQARRNPQPAAEPEPTVEQGEEPECYTFDEYVDPKMTKGVKMAHKNLTKAQKAIKWNTKAIRYILRTLKLTPNLSATERVQNSPEVRLPSPAQHRRSVSTSRPFGVQPTSEQPRRASSVEHRPPPQQGAFEQDHTPRVFGLDLNTDIQFDEPARADDALLADTTTELSLESNPAPLRRRKSTARRSTSRSHRERTRSVEPREEQEVQTEHLTLQTGLPWLDAQASTSRHYSQPPEPNVFDQHGSSSQHFQQQQEFNFLDPMSSASFHYSTPTEQQGQEANDMEVDPFSWSIFP